MSKRWSKNQVKEISEALHIPESDLAALEAEPETAAATEEVATVDPAQARWDKTAADAEAAHNKRANNPLTKARELDEEQRGDPAGNVHLEFLKLYDRLSDEEKEAHPEWFAPELVAHARAHVAKHCIHRK